MPEAAAETEYRFRITGYDEQGTKFGLLTPPTTADALYIMSWYKDLLKTFVQIEIIRVSKDEQDINA